MSQTDLHLSQLHDTVLIYIVSQI